jgi:hypothetical protein
MSMFTQAKVRHQEQRVAYHEAAHIIASILLGGGPPSFVCVTDLPRGACGVGGMAVTDESTPRNSMTVYAAGVVGELMLEQQSPATWQANDMILAKSKIPGVSSAGLAGGGRADESEVQAVLRELVRRLADELTTDQTRIAEIVKKHRLGKLMKTTRWRRWAYIQAERLLFGHWPELHTVARALLAEKTLMGSRVVTLLQQIKDTL